jgi:hypothetical protein
MYNKFVALSLKDIFGFVANCYGFWVKFEKKSRSRCRFEGLDKKGLKKEKACKKNLYRWYLSCL